MSHVVRTRSRFEVQDAAGNPCAVVSERISLSMGSRVAGAGFAYERPIAVERAGAFTPVADVVMIVRLAGLAAVALAMIVGVIRR
jgi:hypothetical protein